MPWPEQEFGQAACAVVAARARRTSFIVGLRRGVREGRPFVPREGCPGFALCLRGPAADFRPETGSVGLLAAWEMPCVCGLVPETLRDAFGA